MNFLEYSSVGQTSQNIYQDGYQVLIHESDSEEEMTREDEWALDRFNQQMQAAHNALEKYKWRKKDDFILVRNNFLEKVSKKLMVKIEETIEKDRESTDLRTIWKQIFGKYEDKRSDNFIEGSKKIFIFLIERGHFELGRDFFDEIYQGVKPAEKMVWVETCADAFLEKRETLDIDTQKKILEAFAVSQLSLFSSYLRSDRDLGEDLGKLYAESLNKLNQSSIMNFYCSECAFEILMLGLKTSPDPKKQYQELMGLCRQAAADSKEVSVEFLEGFWKVQKQLVDASVIEWDDSLAAEELDLIKKCLPRTTEQGLSACCDRLLELSKKEELPQALIGRILTLFRHPLAKNLGEKLLSFSKVLSHQKAFDVSEVPAIIQIFSKIENGKKASLDLLICGIKRICQKTKPKKTDEQLLVDYCALLRKELEDKNLLLSDFEESKSLIFAIYDYVKKLKGNVSLELQLLQVAMDLNGAFIRSGKSFQDISVVYQTIWEEARDYLQQPIPSPFQQNDVEFSDAMNRRKRRIALLEQLVMHSLNASDQKQSLEWIQKALEVFEHCQYLFTADTKKHFFSSYLSFYQKHPHLKVDEKFFDLAPASDFIAPVASRKEMHDFLKILMDSYFDYVLEHANDQEKSPPFDALQFFIACNKFFNDFTLSLWEKGYRCLLAFLDENGKNDTQLAIIRTAEDAMISNFCALYYKSMLGRKVSKEEVDTLLEMIERGGHLVDSSDRRSFKLFDHLTTFAERLIRDQSCDQGEKRTLIEKFFAVLSENCEPRLKKSLDKLVLAAKQEWVVFSRVPKREKEVISNDNSPS